MKGRAIFVAMCGVVLLVVGMKGEIGGGGEEKLGETMSPQGGKTWHKGLRDGECPLPALECVDGESDGNPNYYGCGSTTSDTRSASFSDEIEYESEVFIRSLCEDMEWAEITFSLLSNQLFLPGQTSVSGIILENNVGFDSFEVRDSVNNNPVVVRVLDLSADETLKVTIGFSIVVSDGNEDEIVVENSIWFPDYTEISFPSPRVISIDDGNSEDPDKTCFSQASFLGKICMSAELEDCTISVVLFQDGEQLETTELPVVLPGEAEVCEAVYGGWCQLCSVSPDEWDDLFCPVVQMKCLEVFDLPLRASLDCLSLEESTECSEDCRNCAIPENGYCDEGFCTCNEDFVTSGSDNFQCSTYCGPEHDTKDHSVSPGETVSFSIKQDKFWTGVVSLSEAFDQLEEDQNFLGFELTAVAAQNSEASSREDRASRESRQTSDILSWEFGCRPDMMSESVELSGSESRVFLSDKSGLCPAGFDVLVDGRYENLYFKIQCQSSKCEYDLVVNSVFSTLLNSSVLLPILETPQFMHLEAPVSMDNILKTEVKISLVAYYNEQGELLPVESVNRPPPPLSSSPSPPSAISSSDGIEFVANFGMSVGSCAEFLRKGEEGEQGITVEVARVYGGDEDWQGEEEKREGIVGGLVVGVKEWRVEDAVAQNNGEWFLVLEGVEGLEDYYVFVEVVGSLVTGEDDNDPDADDGDDKPPQSVCEINCVHGSCNESDVCICDEKWEGEYCISYIHDENSGDKGSSSLPQNLPLYIIGGVVVLAAVALVIRSVVREVQARRRISVIRVGGKHLLEEDDEL